MKKRTYKATNVNRVNIESLKKKIQGKEIVIGIDIAKTDNYATIMTKEKESVITVRYKQPVETMRFIEFIQNLQSSRCEAAMESTGTYGDPLREQLLNTGISVFRVSAKRSHDMAEVYDGVPSYHDAKSAAIIAHLHIDGMSQLWQSKPPELRDIKAAINEMSIYHAQYYENINRMEALLARFWPEVPDILSLTTVTLISILEIYGSPTVLAKAPRKTVFEQMKKIGRGFLTDKKIDDAIASAKTTTGVKMTEGEIRMVKHLMTEILRNYRLNKTAEKEVLRLCKNIEEVERMGEIIGMVTAAVIFTELGNPNEFKNAKSYKKSAGLNLKEKSSGNHQGKLRISKRGSSKARQFLYLAVLRLIQNDMLVRAWYNKKVKRDGGKKMIAIVAIMSKLTLALWHVGRGAKFDSHKLFNAAKLDKEYKQLLKEQENNEQKNMKIKKIVIVKPVKPTLLKKQESINKTT
jgi:transposase